MRDGGATGFQAGDRFDWKEIFKALNDIKFVKSMVIEHEDPVFGGQRTDEGLKVGLRDFMRFIL